MAPADDALKFIDNSKTQKNLSSDTNLSDIVGDLSQSNKSLDMIPEKSQNITADNNNIIEAKNVECNNKFIKLLQEQEEEEQQQQQQFDRNKPDKSESSKMLNERKLSKDIDELAKIYHSENDERTRGEQTDFMTDENNDIINDNNISNNNNNNITNINNHDDIADDADDEDEFEKFFEDSMQNLEKQRDNNYESSSADESEDCEYCDKIPKSLLLSTSSSSSSPQSKSPLSIIDIDNTSSNKIGVIQNFISTLPCVNQSGGLSITTKTTTTTTSTPIQIDKKQNRRNNNELNLNADSDISDSDDDSHDKIINEIANSPKLLPNEMLNNHKMFLFRPYSLPFQERRRLSQCKEEDENEDNNDNNKLSVQKSDQSSIIAGNQNNSDAGNHMTTNIKKDKNYIRSPPVPESQLMSDKFKALERLRDQFRRKLEEVHPTTILTSTILIPAETSGTNLNSTNINLNPKIYKGKFVVTRAEDPSSHLLPSLVNNNNNNNTNNINNINNNNNNNIKNNKKHIKIENKVPKLHLDAFKLKYLQQQMNSFTIHFPNSKGISGHTRVQSLFGSADDDNNESDVDDENNDLKRHSVTFQPHLDKQFFDTSMVEIRPISDSTKSLDNCDNNKRSVDDNIWIPRTSNKVTPASSKNSVDDQDGNRSAGPSRPSSAPAEPNAKAARKASKKMEKEAKKQEKELRNKEKEARKIERETARRLEREQAKLEKLNRNSEKISRSTERLAPRSGSLERRRSGEESPVLNQSTVHGIASPNRRPTIFDVFRPRTKSDAKRKEKDAAMHSGSEKDNSSTSSNHSGSGGIMKAVKHVVQNTVGHHRHHQQTTTSASTTTSTSNNEKPSVKYRDGSAHPHAGSDAQYYHTVTAVRRVDVSRSPMTKVMDLFRYRSNSAVNEADKRKARAAAHQQLLAAQSKFLKYFLYFYIFKQKKIFH